MKMTDQSYTFPDQKDNLSQRHDTKLGICDDSDRYWNTSWSESQGKNKITQ